MAIYANLSHLNSGVFLRLEKPRYMKNSTNKTTCILNYQYLIKAI